MKNLFKSASCGNSAKFVWKGEVFSGSNEVNTDVVKNDYKNLEDLNIEDYKSANVIKANDNKFDPDVDKNFIAQVEQTEPYQEKSNYGENVGARNRNKYDITKIKSREDAYGKAGDVLEEFFHPDNEGGYDANTIEWGLNEKLRSPEAKDRLQAIQYMLNFITKYSPDYKGKIPHMFYTENVDGFLKDSRGISNTQAAIREVNKLFGTVESNPFVGVDDYENNQITVSEELMTKLRAETRRILENNEKGGTHVLDGSLELRQKQEQKEMMADVLSIRVNEVDDRWFNWMKNISPEMANDTYKNDFDKFGEYKPSFYDSKLEDDLEKKFNEDNDLLTESYNEKNTQAFIKWLGTPDGQEFLSGKNDKTDDKWTNFGEYVKYKKAHDRRQASVETGMSKYENIA